jgi:hypothetical protein
MPLRPAQRLLEAIVGPSHYPQPHEDDAERTVRSRTFRPKCPPARRWGQPGALPKHTRNKQDPDAYSPPGATRAYTNAGDRSKVPQGTLRGERPLAQLIPSSPAESGSGRSIALGQRFFRGGVPYVAAEAPGTIPGRICRRQGCSAYPLVPAFAGRRRIEAVATQGVSASWTNGRQGAMRQQLLTRNSPIV